MLTRRAAFAIVYGLITHLTFVCAVVLMVTALYQGLRTGLGHLHGWQGALADTLLIVQYPVIHSFFLGARGRRLMARLFPDDLGKDLATTTFALIASIQVIATFALWSPSGVMLFEATGKTLWVFRVLFAFSWLFLGKAMLDAGLGLQTGYIGWRAVSRGNRPAYKKFPTHGLFRMVRQPVYLGFALTLWTTPAYTLDGVLLAIVWTIYCFAGPLLKEARYLNWHGNAYAQYRAAVPYIFPWRRPRT